MIGVYGFDEASQALNQTIARVFEIFKSQFPDVDTVTTAHMQAGTDGSPQQNISKIKAWHLDHFCPILDWIVASDFSACVDAGLKMWFYTSCEPTAPYPNLRLDNPLLDARILFWYASGIRASGYLYWGYNVWQSGLASFEPIAPVGTPADLFLDPHNWNVATCHKCVGSCPGQCDYTPLPSVVLTLVCRQVLGIWT